MSEYNLEFDATPSWSGYNYQGKVALYVVLDKLCKLYEDGRSAEISDFSLELEWIEDFAVIQSVVMRMSTNRFIKLRHLIKLILRTMAKLFLD